MFEKENTRDLLNHLVREKTMLEETIAEYEDSYFFNFEDSDYISACNRLEEVENKIKELRGNVK